MELHPERNLVRTRLYGQITTAHTAQAIVDLEGVLSQFRPGFTILTDLSGLESMELDCAPHFSRIMDLCRDHGVGQVIRIIPDPTKDIGLNILSIIHYGTGVQVITCQTQAEGEKALK